MKIEIGKIIKTIGLKGEVKICPYTLDSEQRFKKGNVINIDNITLQIDSVRYKDNYPIVTFKDYKDINLIQPFLQKTLWIDSNDLPKLDNNSYYGYQIKGFNAVYNNQIIGVIADFEQYGKQLNARITNNDKSFLIPFIKPFIVKINNDNKEVIFTNLEGLL